MAGLARLMVVGFIVLTVIYVCLSLYSRAVRKEKLREEWYEGAQEQPLEAFVEEGLVEYDKSLRRKLILSVYVIPVILVSVIVYLTNFA
jgi:Ca2+/Na+ antiporter